MMKYRNLTPFEKETFRNLFIEFLKKYAKDYEKECKLIGKTQSLDSMFARVMDYETSMCNALSPFIKTIYKNDNEDEINEKVFEIADEVLNHSSVQKTFKQISNKWNKNTLKSHKIQPIKLNIKNMF